MSQKVREIVIRKDEINRKTEGVTSEEAKNQSAGGNVAH